MNTEVEVTHAQGTQLLEEWRDFVRECEAGYNWNVYDYHSDLAVRDRLELALADDPELAASVAEVDAQFRDLLQADVQTGTEEDPWWHRGVLRYAGPELAAGLKEWCQVDVEVREPGDPVPADPES